MPVVVGARRVERLDELVKDIRARGGRAIAAACDVARAEDCQRLVDRGNAEFGPAYAVFANAGFGTESAVHDMDDAALRRIFEVNFFGTMNTIRPALRGMMERGRGRVLICSSCLARFPIPLLGAYSATKAAQHHIGVAMRAELRPLGIGVTTVHPVGTATEFFEVSAAGSAPDGGPPKAVPRVNPMFMQSPEFVASRIVRSLRRAHPPAEIWPGAMGLGLRWTAALFTGVPALTSLLGRGMELQSRRKTAVKMPGGQTDTSRPPS